MPGEMFMTDHTSPSHLLDGLTVFVSWDPGLESLGTALVRRVGNWGAHVASRPPSHGISIYLRDAAGRGLSVRTPRPWRGNARLADAVARQLNVRAHRGWERAPSLPSVHIFNPAPESVEAIARGVALWLTAGDPARFTDLVSQGPPVGEDGGDRPSPAPGAPSSGDAPATVEGSSAATEPSTDVANDTANAPPLVVPQDTDIAVGPSTPPEVTTPPDAENDSAGDDLLAVTENPDPTAADLPTPREVTISPEVPREDSHDVPLAVPHDPDPVTADPDMPQEAPSAPDTVDPVPTPDAEPPGVEAPLPGDPATPRYHAVNAHPFFQQMIAGYGALHPAQSASEERPKAP